MNLPKDTTPKTFCFVLMPFSEAFEDVYKIGIKEACVNAGAYCERVDEQIFHERILDRVYNQIAKADLVIADMTGRNANVFYEVGYAHALGKLTILLTQSADDIPFDLKDFPHIVYGAKNSFLRDELEKRVKHYIENPPEKLSDKKFGVDVYLEEQNLAVGNVRLALMNGDYLKIKLTIFNASLDKLTPENFKLGIITSERFDRTEHTSVATTKLPDGGYQHMLWNLPPLFPSGCSSLQVILIADHNHSFAPGEEDVVTIRLFTEQGARDFQFTAYRD